MLQTLKAKYAPNFKYLNENTVPELVKFDNKALKTKDNIMPEPVKFGNKALKTEVQHFLSTVIEPSLEAKIISYLTSPCNQFRSKFDVTFWYAGSGNIFWLGDNDFGYDTPYSKKNSKCIFNFISSDDIAEIYNYIKHFANKDFDIDVDDCDFEDSKCLKASVDYKK